MRAAPLRSRRRASAAAGDIQQAGAFNRDFRQQPIGGGDRVQHPPAKQRRSVAPAAAPDRPPASTAARAPDAPPCAFRARVMPSVRLPSGSICRLAFNAIRIAWIWRAPAPCSWRIAPSAASLSRSSDHISALVTRRAVSIRGRSRRAQASHPGVHIPASGVRLARRSERRLPRCATTIARPGAAFSARAKRPSSRLRTASTSACWPPTSSRRAR